MLYSIYRALIIIGIIGTALTFNLLIINSVSENRTNMPILQNFKDSQIKYSKDDLLEIRKTVKQDFTLKQINVETLKVIRKYRINRRGKRSGLRKRQLKQHQLGVSECNLRTCLLISPEDKETNIKKGGIKIVTLNARSVKNEDYYIMDCIRNFG